MVTVQPVSNNTNKKTLTLQNTGYAALGSLALTTISASVNYKPLRKKHKHFAFITVLLTLLHIGTALRHRFEKIKNSLCRDNCSVQK